MGWARGSELMDPIIFEAMKAIPDDEMRRTFYEGVIPPFEDLDWDTQDESMGTDPVFDEVIKKLNPQWDEDEEN